MEEFTTEADFGDLSVTIKHDGRDAMWEVFRGTPAQVKRTMAAFYGMEDDPEATAFEVAIEAERLAKAVGNATRTLGGRVLKPGGEAAGSAPASSGSSFARAATAPAASKAPTTEEIVAAMKEQIEATTGVTALKTLWAKNQDLFKIHDELGAAYMVKGKALKEAGAA